MGAMNNRINNERGQPTFRNVELQAIAKHDPDKIKVLGPHCQCSFLTPRPKKKPKRGMEWHPQKAYVEHWPRRSQRQGPVVLPAWVMNSPKIVEQERNAVRFHLQERATAPPVGVPQEGKFRDRIRWILDHGRWGSISRCEMPSLLPSVCDDIDGAISAALAFLRKYLKEQQSLMGSYGKTQAMLGSLSWRPNALIGADCCSLRLRWKTLELLQSCTP